MSMTIGEALAKGLQLGGGVIDVIDARNKARRAESLEADLARKRADAEVARTQAEASAQARALEAQGDMQANLQKWLTWSIAGLVVIGGGVVLGRFIFKRGR